MMGALRRKGRLGHWLIIQFSANAVNLRLVKMMQDQCFADASPAGPFDI